jgi:hypothetical protein
MALDRVIGRHRFLIRDRYLAIGQSAMTALGTASWKARSLVRQGWF